jgi:hypothetical protein
MDWFINWVILIIIFWVLGIIVCGMALAVKSKRTSMLFYFFFILPVFLAIADGVTVGSIIGINEKNALNEFERLCASNAGDKIYKAVKNVRGVLQIRARQPVIDNTRNDQYGMEDPYGDAQGDYEKVEGLVGISRKIERDTYYMGFGVNKGKKLFNSRNIPFGKAGYWFVEQYSAKNNRERPIRFMLTFTGNTADSGEYSISTEQKVIDLIYSTKTLYVPSPKSRYGYLTEDISTKEMRDKWIGAGRIKIINLQTNEVLATRTGYIKGGGPYRSSTPFSFAMRGNWYGSRTCPDNPNSRGLLGFLHKVLKPVQGYPTNEQLELIAKD